jgi:hypothetical protein
MKLTFTLNKDFPNHAGRPGMVGGSAPKGAGNDALPKRTRKAGLTFRTKPVETGRAGVGSPYSDIDISYGGKVFGTIYAPNWRSTDNNYEIRIAIKKPVPDANPNSDWKWIAFNKKFEDPVSAKDFMKRNMNAILQKYTLHYIEE